jgi:hypothetical protein
MGVCSSSGLSKKRASSGCAEVPWLLLAPLFAKIIKQR